MGKAGLAWLIVAALTGAGAYLTGEPAEEVIEDRLGISDAAIEAHEEAAFGAALAAGAAGLLALSYSSPAGGASVRRRGCSRR